MKTNHLKTALVICLCLAMLPSPVWAESSRLTEDAEQRVRQPENGNEFFSGYAPGVTLMPVHVIGAVGRGGIYHIPLRTNLLTALTYAGGPTSLAELDGVVLKRMERNREKVVSINVEDLLGKNRTVPTLEPFDLIYVPSHKSWLNEDGYRVIILLSTVLGMIVSSIFIAERL